MAPTSVLLLSVAALSAACGQLLFKLGAHEKHQLFEFLNFQILLGLFLYGLGTVIWIYALSVEKLVNVFAFTGLTFVLVYAGGVLFLGESITPPAFAGVLLVMFGLYLIAVHGA